MSPTERVRDTSRQGLRPRPSRAGLMKVWNERLRVLASALGREATLGDAAPHRADPEALQAILGALVDPTDRSEVWLTCSVMTACYPMEHEVDEIARRSEFDDGQALADFVVRSTSRRGLRMNVQVAGANEVLVDVDTTVSVPYLTGIQRVARETASRWAAHRSARLVVWTKDWTSLRDLTGREVEEVAAWRADFEPVPAEGARSGRPAPHLLVPWECTLISPELPAEVERTSRLRALARYARCRTGLIAFDCVPITSSETRIDWREEKFALYLSALSQCDALAPISAAAATEFRGWRSSLAAIGQTGPDIRPVLLPGAITPAATEAIASARKRFLVGDVPFVLVVGSREPRKNHVAILHAAELLWRRGLRFSLTFIGGRAWQADTFSQRLQMLQQAGRLVDVAAGTTDEELSAAYALARFTVFPSLNEGFGLPVAESLAAGTPVITSNFGSMREIAEGGGALLVDPRSDEAIADAMERLLTDDELLERLRAEAKARPERTWDDYASEVWDALVGAESSGDFIQPADPA